MQVAKLRTSVKEALIVQQDCEAHKEALNAVGQMLLTSGPDLEATDFKQLLSVKRQLILDDLGCAAHYNVMRFLLPRHMFAHNVPCWLRLQHVTRIRTYLSLSKDASAIASGSARHHMHSANTLFPCSSGFCQTFPVALAR